MSVPAAHEPVSYRWEPDGERLHPQWNDPDFWLSTDLQAPWDIVRGRDILRVRLANGQLVIVRAKP